MSIQCNSEKDCSTGQLCVNRVCSQLNADTLAAKVPPWGWAIIVIVLLLIIFAFVRCCCWPFKSKKDSKPKADGPAPLPMHYKKPVDLMEVADANQRVENALVIEQQKQIRMNSRADQLRKQSSETVYPSSSISQAEYRNYQQDPFVQQDPFAQQIYYETSGQYGFQSQQPYPSQPNQVYYGNTPAKFSKSPPAQASSSSLNNHQSNMQDEMNSYGFQSY